jgi:hypothetical protein
MPKKSQAPKSYGKPNREIAEVWQAMQKLEDTHTAEKKRLLRMSEISLILDNYDDIFSDFDPRPYTERGLSEDFLTEVKRGCKDKTTGEIELTLMVPSHMKDINKELLIEKRLKAHFKKHHTLVSKEIWSVRKKGGLQILGGSALSIITALLRAWHATSPDFLVNFATVIFEPASWFVIWSGYDDIFHSWKNLKPDLYFYHRMTEAKIAFIPY